MIRLTMLWLIFAAGCDELEEVQCLGDSDCASGQICAANQCVHSDRTDGEAEGQVEGDGSVPGEADAEADAEPETSPDEGVDVGPEPDVLEADAGQADVEPEPDAAPDVGDMGPDEGDAADVGPDEGDVADMEPDEVDLGCVPVDETCDGTDENCDGFIDEDLPECAPCGCEFTQGQVGRCHVDEGCEVTGCAEGWRSLPGAEVDSCACEVLAEQDDCGGVDEDCDGEIDEDCACPPGEDHILRREGEVGCEPVGCVEGWWDLDGDLFDHEGACEYRCDPAPERVDHPDLDLIDGVDSDCDGLVDEDRAVVWDTPELCGRALEACAFPAGIAACEEARCVLDRCAPGFLDLNGDPSDGCEDALDPEPIWVDDDNQGEADGSPEMPYPTITEALADGRAENGGVRIAVKAGIYLEAVVVSQPRIQLMAVEEGVRVLPSGEPEAPGLEVTGDHVEVQGLDLRNWRTGVRLACAEGCRLIGAPITVLGVGAEPAFGVVVDGMPAEGDTAYRARGVIVRRNTITATSDGDRAEAFRVNGSVDLRIEHNEVPLVDADWRGTVVAANLYDAVRPQLRGNRFHALGSAFDQRVYGPSFTRGVAARSSHQLIGSGNRVTNGFHLHDHPGFRSTNDYLRGERSGFDQLIHLGAGSLDARITRMTRARARAEDAVTGQSLAHINEPSSLRVTDSLLGLTRDLASFGPAPPSREDELPPEQLSLRRTVISEEEGFQLLRRVGNAFPWGKRTLSIRDVTVVPEGEGVVHRAFEYEAAHAMGPAVDRGDPRADCGLEPANPNGVCRLDVGHLAGTPFAVADEATELPVADRWKARDCSGEGANTEWASQRGECVALRCEEGWADVDGLPGCEAASGVLQKGEAHSEAPPIMDLLREPYDGHTVLIRAGHYRGPLRVSWPNTTIRAVGGPVILEHDGDGPAIEITGNGARVEGFIVRMPERVARTAVSIHDCERCVLAESYIVGLSGEDIVAIRVEDTTDARVERSWVWDLSRLARDPEDADPRGAAAKGIWATASDRLVLRDNIIGRIWTQDSNGSAAFGVYVQTSEGVKLIGNRISKVAAPSRTGCGGSCNSHTAYGLRLSESPDLRSRHNRYSGVDTRASHDGVCAPHKCLIMVDRSPDFRSENDLFKELSGPAVALMDESQGVIQRATVIDESWGRPTFHVAALAWGLSVNDSVLIDPRFRNLTDHADNLSLRHTVHWETDEDAFHPLVDIDETVRELDPLFTLEYWEDYCLGADSQAVDFGVPGGACEFEPAGADLMCHPDVGFCANTPRAQAR